MEDQKSSLSQQITKKQVTIYIHLDPSSYENLKGYYLFVLRAIATDAADSQPIIWKKVPVSNYIELSWNNDSFGAYSSLFPPKDRDKITAMNLWHVESGDELEITNARNVDGKIHKNGVEGEFHINYIEGKLHKKAFRPSLHILPSFSIFNSTAERVICGLYQDSKNEDDDDSLQIFYEYTLKGDQRIRLTPLPQVILFFLDDSHYDVSHVIDSNIEKAALLDWTKVTSDDIDRNPKVDISISNQTWPTNESWLTIGTLDPSLKTSFENFKRISTSDDYFSNSILKDL